MVVFVLDEEWVVDSAKEYISFEINPYAYENGILSDCQEAAFEIGKMYVRSRPNNT